MGSATRLFAASMGVLVLAWLSYCAVSYGVAGSAATNAARELERMSGSVSAGSGEWWKDDLRRAVIDEDIGQSHRTELDAAFEQPGMR